MVLEFRYKNKEGWHGEGAYLHKLHPDLIMKLPKKDIWSRNHVSLFEGEIFKIHVMGKSCGLDMIDVFDANANINLGREKLNKIKNIDLDHIVIWGPESDSPSVWDNSSTNTDKLSSIWIDIDNYQKYRKIVLNMKFDPNNNSDHLVVDGFDKLLIPYYRDNLIDEIVN